MAAPPTTIYDVVPYYSLARTATCVDRIAALGRLLGMKPANPRRCSVLELGCGDGGNVIPMALSFPGSQFLGIDLAPSAIDRARDAALATGVSNAEFRQGDIAELGPGLGEFDYVIAHGVYSWVPTSVRASLLRVIREHMRPKGLAFVSYNALPGDHIRGVVRQMMRMHTAQIADPTRKLHQARALLSLLSRVPGEAGDVYRPLLQSEIGRAMQSSDELLFHDDLADISQPFFFTEFMQAASKAGLQFAAEAVFHSMNIGTLPDDIAALLGDLAARDLVAKEQYLDFLTCRGFRQTLLCHGEVSLRREVDLETMAQFRFFTEAKRAARDDGQSGSVTFRHRNDSALTTDNPMTIRALDRLVDESPASVAFSALAASAGAGAELDGEELANVLFQAFSAGVIELRLAEPAVVLEVSDRPVASSWARLRAATGRAANLYHEVIQFDDLSQELLPLLDGTRTASDLAGTTGRTIPEVTKSLDGLAKLALLVG